MPNVFCNMLIDKDNINRNEEWQRIKTMEDFPMVNFFNDKINMIFLNVLFQHNNVQQNDQPQWMNNLFTFNNCVIKSIWIPLPFLQINHNDGLNVQCLVIQHNNNIVGYIGISFNPRQCDKMQSNDSNIDLYQCYIRARGKLFTPISTSNI